MYNGMKYILENDPEPLCLNFSVNHTVFGEVTLNGSMISSKLTCAMLQTKEIDLKPSGKDIPVTEGNKKEYVEYVCCVVGMVCCRHGVL